MKKSSYKVLAEAITFGGLRDANLSVKVPRRLTKNELMTIVKEEFDKAKEVEDVDVTSDKDWSDAEIENYIEWIKKLNIKESFNLKRK
jgi:hypothetical protein